MLVQRARARAGAAQCVEPVIKRLIRFKQRIHRGFVFRKVDRLHVGIQAKLRERIPKRRIKEAALPSVREILDLLQHLVERHIVHERAAFGLLLLKAEHILRDIARRVREQAEVVLCILLIVKLVKHKVERQVGVQAVVGGKHLLVLVGIHAFRIGGELLLDGVIGELLGFRKRTAVDLPQFS